MQLLLSVASATTPSGADLSFLLFSFLAFSLSPPPNGWHEIHEAQKAASMAIGSLAIVAICCL